MIHENISETGLQVASSSYETINLVRKCIKSMRKIAHSVLFPEKSQILEFFEKHPAVTKIYFISQIFSGIGLILAVLKLKKAIKVAVKSHGLKRFDGIAKALSTVGKAIGTTTTIIAGLEAFQWGQKLGSIGLTMAEKAFESSVQLVDFFGIVGSVLSTASIFHKSYALHETVQLSKELKSKTLPQIEGSKELADGLELEPAVLKTALLYHTTLDTPSQMRKTKEAILGHLEVKKKVCAVKIITSIISLIAIASVFVPVLGSATVLLLCATAVAKLAILFFQHVKQFQFEQKLGIISETGLKGFIRWELGWIEEDSMKRALSTSYVVSKGMTKQLSLLTDVLEAVKVSGKILGRVA